MGSGGGSSVAKSVVKWYSGLTRSSRCGVILRQRVLEWTSLRESGVQRFREVLAVDEGVGNALGCQWVLDVPSISNERPPRAVRLEEEVWDAGCPYSLLFTSRALYSLLDARVRPVQLVDVPLDVGPDFLEPFAGPCTGDQGQAVVRREAGGTLVGDANILLVSSASNPL